ncbi:MAG: peptide chain release factor 2 [Erysipelotrichaceae bacterium]|nr:peptide chain release factor 2 [Erysipelotrichaceae bacterium]
MSLYEIRNFLTTYKKSLQELGDSLEVANINHRIDELRIISSQDDFWDNPKTAQEYLSELKEKETTLERFSYLETSINSLLDLIELVDESDEETVKNIDSEFSKLQEQFLEFENRSLFTKEFDNLNAIIEIHPGAGGTESHDWAEMLFRMYVRWAEKKEFELEILDQLLGNEVGIKSVSFKISGKNIYGLLKGERGVHRLERISPFDSSGRRHTSFASVNVIPDFTHDINIVIDDKDLKIDTYRSGGAGGQNVNKVESAVRITHLPTGLVSACQTERSQLLNKEQALRMLKAKLYHLETQKKQDSLNSIIGEKLEISWGSQIRSYTFCPYTLVKDRRTSYSTPDVAGVMAGEIDGFLFSYLRWIK